MKLIRRLLLVGAVVGVTIFGQRAEGCGLGFQLYLPFFSFGFGLGVPTAYTYPCVQPACYYPCGAPVASDSAPQMPPPMQPVFETLPARWTPGTPGPGHWVPDPQPYRYLPAAPAKPKPQAQTVTLTKTLGDVPLYVVQTEH
jgi:hypothetical protein